MMTRTQFVQRLAEVERRATPRQVAVPGAVQLMQAAGIVPDPWQRQVLTSSAPRLLLNCCRQSGKTATAAALALSTALNGSGDLVLILSPSLRQSQESFHAVLALLRAWAQPIPTQAESALRLELPNGSRIISLPGTESTIRGYSGVSLLVIDEAARVSDELYYSVRPMVAISQGRILALSTPFGQRGWWHQAWTAGDGWERVEVNAFACPRICADFLDEERRSMPPLFFRSEYLCEFCDVVDQVFATELLMQAMRDDVAPLWENEA